MQPISICLSVYLSVCLSVYLPMYIIYVFILYDVPVHTMYCKHVVIIQHIFFVSNVSKEYAQILCETRNTAFRRPWCFCDQRGVMDDV